MTSVQSLLGMAASVGTSLGGAFAPIAKRYGTPVASEADIEALGRDFSVIGRDLKTVVARRDAQSGR